MFKRKLQQQNKWNKKKIDKKVYSNNQQAKDSTIGFAIFSQFSKWLILIFFGGIILFPFFFMISSALMSNAEAKDVFNSHIVPKAGLHWENFAEAFKSGYWGALLTTLIVTSLSIVLKLFLTILMGYAFSYKKWRFKNTIWYFLLALMMIPEIGLLVGQYKITVSMNLHIGNQIIVAMFLPFIASIFSAFMFRNAFEAIPARTKEAAMLDGASELKYFWKVALPMVSPTVWTVLILTAFASWNSYMWPQLLAFGATKGHTNYVLGTWLFTTGKELDTNGAVVGVLKNVRMAAAILVTLPLMIAYFVFRGRIMRAVGKQGSAIKG